MAGGPLTPPQLAQEPGVGAQEYPFRGGEGLPQFGAVVRGPILEAIAAERSIPLAALVAEIDAARPRSTNLSSALRLHVLEWSVGHRSAGAS